MVIGERIKQARINQGLTQEDLGKALNVSKVSICGYEKGTRTPTMENFMKLIEILECDPNYLLGRDIEAKVENKKVTLLKEDIKIIRELKKHNELYYKIIYDPVRTIELIRRRIK